MDDRTLFTWCKRILLAICLPAFLLTVADAQTIYEIWTPQVGKGESGSAFGSCVFRKKLLLNDPVEGEIFLAAKDAYELFLNGQLVHQGNSSGSPVKFNVNSLLIPGTNVIAVRVAHGASPTAGLAVKFRVREQDESRWRSLTTDESWKTSVGPAANWSAIELQDRNWGKANKLASVRFSPNEIRTPAAVSSSATPPTPTGPPENQFASSRTDRASQTSPPDLLSANPTTNDSSRTPKYQLGGTQANNDSERFLNRTPDVRESGSSTREASSARPSPPSTRQASSRKDDSAPKYKMGGQSPDVPVGSRQSQPTSEPGASGLADRFTIDPEFEVQQVMLDSETGSLIAMAFNEFGNLILSKEGGPLMLADITKQPGDAGRMKVLCSQMKSCQGILPMNGQIYVTGDGPSGMGLYLLTDQNRDGLFDVDRVIVPFSGKLGEHGPHGIELGPDGMLYVSVGNASECSSATAKTSPYYHSYEADLVPRMEDPGGHAVGVKAPGGTIIRTSLDGEFVETVCGGVRNAYDLVFDQHGELFIHDSDLETNVGMAWYRPTRIYHVPHGAELGWRSGWSKFPDYFADVTPPVALTGRGSPSGATLYQHFQFPARFHNSIFFADWSEGRILVARPEQKGAGYEMEVDTFVTGRPMNITDLSVGVDGTLFFCTGGRGTGGGVYRVTWSGEVPEELYSYKNEFERVIRMPQPNSAWGRQALALLRKELNKDWESALNGIATDTRNETEYRLRAIELLFFYGPFPKSEVIQQLATDDEEIIRARIASLCGVKRDAKLNANLDQLVADQSALVRRRAAESYFRIGELPPVGKILAMLASKDRTEATVARRLIERAPVESYQDRVLNTEDSTLFVNGAIAMMTANPKLDLAYKILARSTHFMDGYLPDDEFVDLLRAAQIALVQGRVDPFQIQGFGDRICSEFPAGNAQINKQLAMIMGFMKNCTAGDRIPGYFQDSPNNPADKLFVAMYLQKISSTLSSDSRFALIDYLEQAMLTQEGSTYRNYVSTAIKQVAKNCQGPELDEILKNGGRWPHAMLQTFFTLDSRLTSEQVRHVIDADQAMPNESDSFSRRVRLGSIAMLAESNNPEAFAYLRKIWQDRPDFRNEISLGLAQQPEKENWAYLVSSMPVLDDTIGKDIVQSLQGVNRRPKQPRQYRELIEMGFRLRESGALEVSNLMKHWSGTDVRQASSNSLPRWEQAMNHWVEWFAGEYPSERPISQKSLSKIGNYSADQVLEHLNEFEIQGNPAIGRLVFQKANCIACHRVGSEGATFGPDLSNLASRFSRREILESIIDPSKVVSDQYRSKKILTVDGEQLFGMLIRDSSGDYLLQDAEGKTIRIADDDIEEIKETTLSSMPEDLLNSLSLDEILHLFAYIDRSSNKKSNFDPSTVQ